MYVVPPTTYLPIMYVHKKFTLFSNSKKHLNGSIISIKLQQFTILVSYLQSYVVMGERGSNFEMI